MGGTPFYLKALLCGLFASPPVDQNCVTDLGPTETDGRRRSQLWPRWIRHQPDDCIERRPPRGPGAGGVAPDGQADQRRQRQSCGTGHPALGSSCLVVDVPGRCCTLGSTDPLEACCGRVGR